MRTHHHKTSLLWNVIQSLRLEQFVWNNHVANILHHTCANWSCICTDRDFLQIFL